MLSKSSTLLRLNVVLICTGSPTSFAHSIASMVRSNEPDIPRKASCISRIRSVKAHRQPCQATLLQPPNQSASTEALRWG